MLQIVRSRLPERFWPVFDLLHTGMTEKAIAEALIVSVHTVHVHVKSIYRVAGVHSRTELLARMIQDIRGSDLQSPSVLDAETEQLQVAVAA